MRAWPGTSSPRVPRERGAHAPGHRRPLVPHAHVERGPVHHRAVAGEADGRVGPEPPLGALPPEHARLELQPVAGGQHDVPPDLHVARLPEQVPFFTHDRPRPVPLDDAHRDLLERRASFLLEDEGLLGLEPPAHATRYLLQLHLLDPEVGARGRRSRDLHARRAALRDERGGHDDCEHGDDAEDQAREAPWICQPGCVGAHQSQHDALMQFRYQRITARRAREGKSADARRFSLAGCRACG